MTESPACASASAIRPVPQPNSNTGTARRLRQAVIERDVAGDRRCAARIERVVCSDEEGFGTLVESIQPRLPRRG